MSRQALCLIKLLIIFSIFECCVCCSSRKRILNSNIIYTYRSYVTLQFESIGEPSTLLAVLSRCEFVGASTSDLIRSYFKLLTFNRNTSRKMEIVAKNIYEVFPKPHKFEILSREDFNENNCGQITTPYDLCFIDYKKCKKNFDTSYGVPGLYTKRDHCVKLLEKLGYNKDSYEELKMIKENQTEGICPLTDLEILLLAPNMNSTSENRTLTRMQLRPAFQILKREFEAEHRLYEMINLTDGPHEFKNNSRVLEYYALINNKITNGIRNHLIRRVFNVDREPRITFWFATELSEDDICRQGNTSLPIRYEQLD